MAVSLATLRARSKVHAAADNSDAMHILDEFMATTSIEPPPSRLPLAPYFASFEKYNVLAGQLRARLKEFNFHIYKAHAFSVSRPLVPDVAIHLPLLQRLDEFLSNFAKNLLPPLEAHRQPPYFL